jgi:hypothetical protein
MLGSYKSPNLAKVYLVQLLEILADFSAAINATPVSFLPNSVVFWPLSQMLWYQFATRQKILHKTGHIV